MITSNSCIVVKYTYVYTYVHLCTYMDVYICVDLCTRHYVYINYQMIIDTNTLFSAFVQILITF